MKSILIHNLLEITTEGPNKQSSQIAYIVAGSVGAFVGLMAIIAILTYCIVKKKNNIKKISSDEHHIETRI